MTTFVLVHGAFRGSWWWHRVGDLLRSSGHEVIAPTLTGLGERAAELAPGQNLETYVDDIVAQLRLDDLRQVTLVAHSYGGYPATVAADRESERIARLVYLDAAVPEHGQSSASAAPEAWVRGAGEDGWSVPPVPVEALEVNAADREAVRSRLTRMPLAALVQRASLTGAVEAIPRRDFVFATGWAATPYRAQAERLRAAPGWTVTEVPTGHEVMLDAPEWVADFLSSG